MFAIMVLQSMGVRVPESVVGMARPVVCALVAQKVLPFLYTHDELIVIVNMLDLVGNHSPPRIVCIVVSGWQLLVVHDTTCDPAIVEPIVGVMDQPDHGCFSKQFVPNICIWHTPKGTLPRPRCR